MGCWSSVRVMWDGGIPSKVLKPEKGARFQAKAFLGPIISIKIIIKPLYTCISAYVGRKVKVPMVEMVVSVVRAVSSSALDLYVIIVPRSHYTYTHYRTSL